MRTMMNKPSRHRYPMMIIGQAIWQYHRFNQSYRDVREQLLYRGIDISHETIRNWCYKFGQKFSDVTSQIAYGNGSIIGNNAV